MRYVKILTLELIKYYKIVYLVQLVWRKTLILISINILDIELDLIDMNFFSHPSGGTGRNVITFWVDMNSYTKTDNKKRDILVLGKGPTQGLEHTVCRKNKFN